MGAFGGDLSENPLKNLVKPSDFQAEYEGSIPFTRSNVFNGLYVIFKMRLHRSPPWVTTWVTKNDLAWRGMMTDPIEALTQIRKLVDVASESDDIAIVRKHLEMVRVIIDKATTADSFQTSVGQPRSGR
jgi:hypothetical protein